MRRRGVEVLRAQDDAAGRFLDPRLLDRATVLGRTLFNHDSDFLVEAAGRQRTGGMFAGIIYAHPLGITIGQCIDELELVAKVYNPHEFLNTILYLPLR